jgi:hypothetical protein
MSTNDQAPAQRSLPQLFWGMIARPRRTLEYLSQDGKRLWWVPALVILVLIVLPTIISPASAAQTPSSSMGMESMGPYEGAAMVETPTPSATSPLVGILGVAGRALSTAITWALWGGALYLASVFLGRSSTFKQMLRLTIWTWLPYGVRGVLQTVYILVSGQAITNPGLSGFVIDRSAQSLVPAGPGQIALAAMLSRVDLFLVWNLFLLITGLMVTTRLTRRKSVIAVLAIWVIFSLLGVIPALAGNLFSQVGQTLF